MVFLFGDKWLQTADYFQILILSGFAYPVSALLVNVLASRGKSRVFLRLEIYKKLLLGLCFSVLYFWGVEAYLYGLIAVAVGGVLLNIYFVSCEINLSMQRLAGPIIVQALISTISVLATFLIVMNLELGTGVLLFSAKIVFFVLFYTLSSRLLLTTSYEVVSGQFYSLLKKYRPGI